MTDHPRPPVDSKRAEYSKERVEEYQHQSESVEEHIAILNENKYKNVPLCCSARYNLAIMMFIGFCMAYALRVDLSVAMIAMVNGSEHSSHLNSSEEICPKHDNYNTTNGGIPSSVEVYNWDSETQGIILSAFFYGYLFTQILGGYLAGRFGGKMILGYGILIAAIFTLLTPIAAKLGVPYLIAVRAIEGLGEGVMFPAMFAMMAHWAPPLERTKLSTIASAGTQFGTLISLPLSGMISQYLGWPWIFYIFGGATIVWFIFWQILISDLPQNHPRISELEKNYIVDSLANQVTASHGWSIPILSMVKSVPLWAIIVAHFAANWSFYTLLTGLPTYLSEILRFNIKENSFLSALPYLGGWFATLSGGQVADFLRKRNICSTLAVRKVFTLLGTLIPATFLIAAGYVGCNYMEAIALLALSTTFAGLNGSGFAVNHLDIAPQYAGFLMGITNTFGTIPGIVGPTVTGFLTTEGTLHGWQIVFFISAGVNVFGALFYSVFGQNEIQEWAKQ